VVLAVLLATGFLRRLLADLLDLLPSLPRSLLLMRKLGCPCGCVGASVGSDRAVVVLVVAVGCRAPHRALRSQLQSRVAVERCLHGLSLATRVLNTTVHSNKRR